jgi:DNA-binding LacI/PurR family transcriptional regulator
MAIPQGRTGSAGPGRPRRPTAADVAREAGLSRATVSYVLNDTPHQVIPEATRRRVLDAAAALGYTPSAAARALVSGRSDVVLLLLPDWPIGPSVGALIEHLSAALAAHGYTFVAHPRTPGRGVGEVWKAITPAAVVTFEDLDETESARLRSAGIELAVALLGVRGGRAMDVPEERAGRLQVEHLAAAGHRRIGYAYPDDPRVQGFARPRLAGARQACAELGLPEPVVETVPLERAGAAAAVRRWRAAAAVGAVAAYNDEVALAVLAGARDAGVGVPADLAVVGVDDIPAAAFAAPALTTVSADLAVLAAYIADDIVGRLAGDPAPPRPGSDLHSVVVRESA